MREDSEFIRPYTVGYLRLHGIVPMSLMPEEMFIRYIADCFNIDQDQFITFCKVEKLSSQLEDTGWNRAGIAGTVLSLRLFEPSSLYPTPDGWSYAEREAPYYVKCPCGQRHMNPYYRDHKCKTGLLMSNEAHCPCSCECCTTVEWETQLALSDWMLEYNRKHPDNRIDSKFLDKATMTEFLYLALDS